MRWIFSLLLLTPTVTAFGQEAPMAWKVGVASQVITPKKNVWMAGYASRKKPAEGKAQELFAKALALEDHRGERFVIVTLDLIGITRIMRDEVARQAEQKYRLPKERLLLNASHTHSGPLVRPRPSTANPVNPVNPVNEMQQRDRSPRGDST